MQVGDLSRSLIATKVFHWCSPVGRESLRVILFRLVPFFVFHQWLFSTITLGKESLEYLHQEIQFFIETSMCVNIATKGFPKQG